MVDILVFPLVFKNVINFKLYVLCSKISTIIYVDKMYFYGLLHCALKFNLI